MYEHIPQNGDNNAHLFSPKNITEKGDKLDWLDKDEQGTSLFEEEEIA